MTLVQSLPSSAFLYCGLFCPKAVLIGLFFRLLHSSILRGERPTDRPSDLASKLSRSGFCCRLFARLWRPRSLVASALRPQQRLGGFRQFFPRRIVPSGSSKSTVAGGGLAASASHLQKMHDSPFLAFYFGLQPCSWV